MSDNAVRKPYQPPKLQKLTPEQANLLLLGRASVGDQNATDLLELIYPEPSEKVS
jgi:hypothetical protein